MFLARASLLFVLSASILTSVFAQRMVLTGTVLEQGSATPLADITVGSADGEAFAKTGVDGRFELSVEQKPERILIEAEGFRQNELPVPANASGENFDLGTVFLLPLAILDELDDERNANGTELQSDDADFGAAATVSSLLVASRDPFQQAAAFNFNATRFRIRGYDNRYTEVFLNGAPVNDPEGGRPRFFLWGGLNDVTRNRQNTIGLGFNAFDPAALGGVGDIDLRAGSQRPVTRVSLAGSNRSWRMRGMATHSTGWLPSDWAFSISGSARYADEGYLPGTYQQAFSYFASAERRINETHRLSLTVMAAPSLRGGAGSSVQEAYDLAGSNYYNPNWGFQAGEVRNSREYRTHQPIALLTHEWSPTPTTGMTTTLLGMAGRNGQTRLERDGAPNPLGTYYQYLPSFAQNPEARAAAEAAFRANPERLQIDWDELYAINRRQDDIVRNAGGIEGNDVSGAVARYWVEEQRSDPRRLSLANRFRHGITSRLTVHTGVQAMYSSTHNYKEMDDLLGADFAVDINGFALRDLGDRDAAQNNLDQPDGIVREGDQFGWDYDSRVARAQLYTQLEYTGGLVDVYGSLSAQQERQWRVGNIRNGQFPETSFGESCTEIFNTGTARAGLTYKLNGRNYFAVNGLYGTAAPEFRESMVSPRTRHDFVDNLEVEKIASLEGVYQYRAPRLKAKLSAYHTTFTDQMRNIRFFVETADNNTGFGSYVLQGLNSQHLGFEAAAEYDVTSSLEVTAALAAGRHTYTSRPVANAFVDNSGEQIVTDEIIYWNNFFIPQSPQQVGSLGLRYQGKQYYTVTLTGSYARYSFSDIGPLRRTPDAVRNLEPNSPEVAAIVDQEELPEAFTLDLFATKSLKFGDQFVYFTAAVNNLLNNQGIISGAREQLRYDFESQDVNRFPSRYFYSYGTNFFVQVAYQF